MELEEQKTDDFEVLFDLPVDFDLAKSEGEGRRCVAGFASTEDLDKDREQILQKGLDYAPLAADGYINYDHQKRVLSGIRVPMIIGYPTAVEMRDRGLWVEGELLKGDPVMSEQLRLANEMWELGVALQKSGTRRLAYSIEGNVTGRRGNKIISAVCKHVALTHKPVNSACTVEVFAKSICCGRCHSSHPDYNPSHSCHNKHTDAGIEEVAKALETTNSGPITTERTSPIMKENLHGALTSTLYGETACDCFDPSTGEFKKGLAGARYHLINCMGYGRDKSGQLLRRVLNGADNNEEILALCHRAGLIRH